MIFGSEPSWILNDAKVEYLLYCGAVDVIANAFAIFSSTSVRFFEYFCKTVINPSIITSCEASLRSKDVSNEREVVRSSSVLIGGILVTPRNFPRRSIPSSMSSLMFTNIVSGKRDQIPVLVKCTSPERCESATSFGQVLTTRC